MVSSHGDRELYVKDPQAPYGNLCYKTLNYLRVTSTGTISWADFKVYLKTFGSRGSVFCGCLEEVFPRMPCAN